ncbi:MAG: hypothetical protein JW741_00910 [Sedimentisphaerales bacterium]|nr:hypothetical protein [Sedimentisphaerales bacterium]
MESKRASKVALRTLVFAVLATFVVDAPARAATVRLEGESLRVEVDRESGQWSLLDKRSDVQWPTEASAGPGRSSRLEGAFTQSRSGQVNSLRLVNEKGGIVVFTLVDGGRTLELRYENLGEDTVRVLREALAITDRDGGYAIVPCREGLLVPADSEKEFKRTFGTSDYEGCHMNMLGLVKSGSALIATWDDAYVCPELERRIASDESYRCKLTATFDLRRSARVLRLTPLGKGDWDTVAGAYRQYAREQGLAVTLREKIRRDPHLERMLGASNAKLWTCLARRMNEESTAEESVKVRWTFDEAARIAEHLRDDLDIERCFFMMGGWTEGGYDVRHPDNLPANPECGGNEALADAVARIQKQSYVACLHDNVQDMYRDAKSWDPSFIEKRPDGSLITGGRWLGGRAYMVCAVKQLELAQRSQNLPAIAELFAPWSYFIDTTYAVGPRECYDPNHPIGRNEDIAWKIRLSDYARNQFGIFGSECGREWALPHSDFFEGLVGVSGRYYHNLKPDEMGAAVIPFFEMVYHDCQVCYGKYGYRAEEAAEYVAHHVLCARPLHYHSFPDHLYWQTVGAESKRSADDRACYTRSDGGWAEGMHPLDVFIKNTHEVLGPLQHVTAHDRLTKFEYLTDDKTVRRATYGSGDDATQVTVNFGSKEAEVSSRFGGRTVLPPYGFLAEGPRLIAFHARYWNNQAYKDSALFTLQPKDNRPLSKSNTIRIFHAFGTTTINWKGETHEVPREETIRPNR